MKTYKLVSVVLMSLFAVTGLLFLLVPEQVIELLNNLSTPLGMLESPVAGSGFYLILAVAYMYIVTSLAFLMYKHPENPYFPQLLAQAKIASSLLSLGFFLLHQHYLIYLANFVIDGFIGAIVIILYIKKRKLTQWASS